MLKKNLHWFIIIIFLANCARQTSPTGGPKDTIPPKLISSDPQHKSINFKGRTLELDFSEYIVLNNPKEQLIITPSVGKKFEVEARRNKAIISLESDLQDSTTYTFNFRETVQDITEKNPSRKLLLAFSTGSYVDSLSLAGTVTDLLKGTPIENVTVAINDLNDTFNIFKHPAPAFTKSNKDGSYLLDYLRPSTYTVYAVDDRNKNLIADSKSELYGYLDKPLQLTSDTTRINIALVKLDARPLKLTSSRPYNTYFNIKASKNLKNIRVTRPDNTPVYYAYGEDQATIKIYKHQMESDSTAINYSAVDSIGNRIDTTLYAKFQNREVEKEKSNAAITSKKLLGDKGQLTIKLNFTKPIQTVSFDSLFFQKDSINLYPITDRDLNWNEQRTMLTISASLDRSWYKSNPDEPTLPKTEKRQPDLNTFTAAKGTFISIEQDTAKAISEKINPLRTEDLSQIFFQIKTQSKTIIVQLLNKEYQPIAEKYNTPESQFDDVEPGDYYVRVILDTNGNKEWDPGNYLLKQPPERVYYLLNDGKTLINLKANWELVLPMLTTD
jgi:hypothetical protein